MHRISDTPKTYRHGDYVIEALPQRIAGHEGWLHWLVRAGNGPGSWYASSLADARQLIEELELAALEAEALAVLAGEGVTAAEPTA